MKYIKLRLNWNPKIIGVKNGVQQVEIKDNGFLDEIYFKKIYDFLKNPKFSNPEFEIKLEGIAPLKGMKLTDVLSYGPYFFNVPFIVSEKVKNIFDKFILPEHYYFPVSFLPSIAVNTQYYLFYVKMYGYEIVNEKECLFFNGSKLSGKEYIKFDNVKENLSNFVGTEVLTFNNKLPLKIDFFKQGLSSGILISVSLWQALENANATGFLFIEPEEPIIRFSDSEKDNTSCW
jgi:hypothetical protein